MTALPTDPPPRWVSPEEYLEAEYDREFRHEYHDGVVVDMSGGTPDHSLIIANLIVAIGVQLKGKPCHLYDSNLRVRAVKKNSYFYPDASIICGPLIQDRICRLGQTVVNPTATFEVLSPKTESFDQSGKFSAYRDIETLKHYCIITATSASIEAYSRRDDGSWLFHPVRNLDGQARLESVDVSIALAEVYAGVEFPSSPNQE